MAAYPNYGILLESRQTRESSYQDDVSMAGTLHSRQMRTSAYINFSLVHNMTVAEFNALLTTYYAGERDTYTLTYYAESPAVTYSVKFVAPPQITQNFGNSRVTVRTELRGTKD